MATLGKGIANLGEGIARYDDAQTSFDTRKRISDYQVGQVELDSSFDQDQDFATRQKRYAEGQQKLRDRVLEGADPRVAESFNIQVAPVAARAAERQKDISFKLQTDDKLATLHTTGNAVMDAAAKTPDPQARDRMVRDYLGMVDAVREQGHMTQTGSQSYKEAWGQKYVMTRGAAAAAAGEGESVINDLQATPNSIEDIANRVIRVESGGDPKKRASTTSAYGVAQFLATGKDTTWRDLINEFRPDLAQGKSVAEVDDMRADPNLSKEMLVKLLDKNKGILSREGIDASPAALYLTHFLGPKSAVAVLKASPGKPVADVLAAAVGPQFARQMIEANMSVLGGRQVGTLVQWAESKMGGAGNSALYGLLRPEQREQLKAHAEGALHKQKVDDFSDFQSRVKDSEVEARATGGVKQEIGQWEFISRLGYEQGKKEHGSYSANVQMGRDEATLANLDPQETSALFRKYEPQPGPGYAEQIERRDKLMTARGRIEKEQSDDPALFAVSRLPAVGAAWGRLQEVLNKPGATIDDQRLAAKRYVNASMMEQGRVGIPAEQRRIATNNYIDDLVAKFTHQPAAGGASNVAALIEEQGRLWGDAWPMVYRDLTKKGISPVALVIGAGVKPAEARILVDLQPHTAKQILRDETDERLTPLVTAVHEQMRPFAKSTMGHDGRSTLLEAVQGQVLKLAAYYMAAGDGATAAAKKAHENLLGFKYEYGDTWGSPWRMPAKQHREASGVDKAAVHAGSVHVRTMIKEGQFAIMPATDDMGGLSVEYRTKELERAAARDGVWTTSPDEKGLTLTYNGTPVMLGQERDGKRVSDKPLTLTWRELAEIAAARPPWLHRPLNVSAPSLAPAAAAPAKASSTIAPATSPTAPKPDEPPKEGRRRSEMIFDTAQSVRRRLFGGDGDLP